MAQKTEPRSEAKCYRFTTAQVAQKTINADSYNLAGFTTAQVAQKSKCKSIFNSNRFTTAQVAQKPKLLLVLIFQCLHHRIGGLETQTKTLTSAVNNGEKHLVDFY